MKRSEFIPELRDGLKEIAFGEWEGKTRAEASESFHDDYLRWLADPAWNAPTGGETAVATAERLIRVINEIRSAVPNGDVLVVSHKSAIRIIYARCSGLTSLDFAFDLHVPWQA